MGKVYYREQKHICGRDYETAPYMEVDLYPVTLRQHKASGRAKKKKLLPLPSRTTTITGQRDTMSRSSTPISSRGISTGLEPMTMHTCLIPEIRKEQTGIGAIISRSCTAGAIRTVWSAPSGSWLPSTAQNRRTEHLLAVTITTPSSKKPRD